VTAASRQPPLVAPFRAVRYADPAVLPARIAPPYDVVSPRERERLAAGDPHNVVHYILPQGDGPERYTRAREILEEWFAGGVLMREEEPVVVVVRQEFGTAEGQAHVRTGVIGAVAAEPFAVGRVHPHERTHEGPKEDRLALLRATEFVFEELLMVVPDRDGVLQEALRDVTTESPLATAELSGVRVAIWVIKGSPAAGLAAAAGTDGAYVADGHHRYETAVTYRGENRRADRIPALLIPLGDPGLVVRPTHRLITGTALDRLALEAKFREWFQIKELPLSASYAEELAALERRGTACVVVVPPGAAFAMLLKSGAKLDDIVTGLHPTVASLDIMRIDELVVRKLRSAAGAEAQIEYSADIGEVIDAVRDGTGAAGVLVNPTPVETMLAVADAGEVMPPKSTYFFPKVPSGLAGMWYGG
jgi:uncharacterized protein (DUF1015 family)